MKEKIKKFFDIFIFILFLPLFLLEVVLILLYKAVISPAIPHSCRFTPCCSTYFLQALEEYGVFVGSFMGILRIFRCNPRSKGGLDPVKPNIKGKIKWVL